MSGISCIFVALLMFDIVFNSPITIDAIPANRDVRQTGNFGGFMWDDSLNMSTSTVQPASQSPTTIAIPGMETTRSPCEDRCQATPQYDPICGSNGVTYSNMAWFTCAQRCGRNVTINYRGACPRTG